MQIKRPGLLRFGGMKRGALNSRQGALGARIPAMKSVNPALQRHKAASLREDVLTAINWLAKYRHSSDLLFCVAHGLF